MGEDNHNNWVKIIHRRVDPSAGEIIDEKTLELSSHDLPTKELTDLAISMVENKKIWVSK